MKTALHKFVMPQNAADIISDLRFFVNGQPQLFALRAGSVALDAIEGLLSAQGLPPIPPDIAMGTLRIDGVGEVIYAPDFDDAGSARKLEIRRLHQPQPNIVRVEPSPPPGETV